ncbi:MAG: tail fiber domain-containing protein [Bacteroidetes bacterium]|nr:tail fiber domain-containing protein [Bacteroidota bacterium]
MVAKTGIYSESTGSSDTTTSTGFISRGITAVGGPGNESAGVVASAGGGRFNYGLIGYCGPNYSPSDSDNTKKNWAGYFFGDIIYSRAFKWSDEKLKSDIKPIETALDKLSRVQTSTYTFKTREFAQLDLPEGNQIGFVAENMEKVFPELVKESRSPRIVKGRDHQIVRESATFKAVNYEGIIPVVVAAINEQSLKTNHNETLMNARITQLENEVAVLRRQLTDRGNNDSPTGYLMQNVPNPFNQSTVINYELSNEAKSAVIVIRGLKGEELKQYKLVDTGKGQIKINANEIAQGTYTYTLMVNGMSVDTKLMVITK